MLGYHVTLNHVFRKIVFSMYFSFGLRKKVQNHLLKRRGTGCDMVDCDTMKITNKFPKTEPPFYW